MKFVADENIPLLSVQILRREGHQINAILDDAPGLSDTGVLDFARQRDSLLLTFDRDFGRLLFKEKVAPPLGLILFRFILKTPQMPARLLDELITNETIEFEGQFTVIEQDVVRQRRLPD